MSTQTQISGDAVVIEANIPEGRKVAGLEYGAHVSQIGWCGKYVRIPGTSQWGVARLTPASDELPGDGTDAEIVEAVREAITLAVEARDLQRAEREYWDHQFRLMMEWTAAQMKAIKGRGYDKAIRGGKYIS